jgi:hypothetical protein
LIQVAGKLFLTLFLLTIAALQPALFTAEQALAVADFLAVADC